MLHKPMRAILLLAVAAPALFAASQAGYPDKTAPSSVTGTKVLTAPEAAKLLPDSVFFRGQSAPIQARNSGGVQFAKDALLLISLVDTAGYSSSVQEKYQAYLITEAAIDIEGHRLEPGAYGVVFLPATPSSLWTLAATIYFPSALPRTLICGVPLLCECCHPPEA